MARFWTTRRMAVCRGMSWYSIRYASTSDEERLIPMMQCTRTFPEEGRDLVTYRLYGFNRRRDRSLSSLVKITPTTSFDGLELLIQLFLHTSRVQHNPPSVSKTLQPHIRKRSLLLSRDAFIYQKYCDIYEILLPFKIAVFYVNICFTYHYSSVTWSSEIIIIYWFTAQETFLIIINV